MKEQSTNFARILPISFPDLTRFTELHRNFEILAVRIQKAAKILTNLALLADYSQGNSDISTHKKHNIFSHAKFE